MNGAELIAKLAALSPEELELTVVVPSVGHSGAEADAPVVKEIPNGIVDHKIVYERVIWVGE